MLTNFHCGHLFTIYIQYITFTIKHTLVFIALSHCMQKILILHITSHHKSCLNVLHHGHKARQLGSLNIICNIYFYQWIIFADNTYLYDSGLMT